MTHIKLLAKVVAQSSNANSFGLRQHVIVLQTGEAFKACRSAYTPDADDFAHNSVFGLYVDYDNVWEDAAFQLSLRGFELVERAPRCPDALLANFDFSQK